MKKEFDKAIQDYTDTIRLDPTDATVYYWRGCLWYFTKENDKAIADLTDTIRLDPKFARAYYFRAAVYFEKQKFDEVVADLTEAIRLNPKDRYALNKRGTAYAKRKEYDKAIADYTEVIHLGPESADSYYNRGIAHSDKKEYAKAIADYTEAIRLNPKDPDAKGNLAWILATCPKDDVRDGKKAVEYATKACELSNWRNAIDLYILAAAYAESGNFKEAVKWQKKAIELGFPDKGKEKKAQERLKLYEAGKPFRDE